MILKPLHYDLTFDTDLVTFQFKGKEEFYFELTKPTNSIELDAVEMTVEHCFLLTGKDKQQVDFKLNKKAEKLIIHFPKRLKKGEYALEIGFKGLLNDHLSGFYRSKYSYQGEEDYIATTQFEAADARRAFPCIDHPLYKATFAVTIICNKHLTSLSNMLPIKEDVIGEKKRTKFAPTPRMSTYLLYLGVGAFEILEDTYKDVKVRVITTPGKKTHGVFALQIAKNCLSYYEDYFGYAYPLPKMDLIAVPDFASGAMENWGAITFRENALLFYEGISSVATKQRITEVIAHEIVHQWFGNLVTMKWWDDLWLNESFATYMAYKAMDAFFPQWHIWNEYIGYAVFGAMALDGLKSTHAIKSKVTHISQIDELFDEIAYEKGGSILRMLDSYLDYEHFEQGLKKYIKKYAYSNAEAKDLWETLEITAKKPVMSVMKSFVVQEGFPQVTLARKKGKYELTQERFLYDGVEKKKLWNIPLSLSFGGNREIKLFKKKTELWEKTGIENGSSFINSNKDCSGFYITNYSDELLDEVGKNLSSLSSADKLCVLHDQFSLVTSVKKDLNATLRFINVYFNDEKDPEVLEYLLGKLWGFYTLLKKETLKEAVYESAKRSLNVVGFDPVPDEDVQITHLRLMCLSVLSYMKDPVVLKKLASYFDLFIKNRSSLHPDLYGVTFASAVRSRKENWEKIKALYEKEEIYEVKVKLLVALGNAPTIEYVEKALTYSLTSQIRLADLMYAIGGAARNPDVTNEVFDWFVLHWPKIKGQTGGHSTTLLRRLLKMIVPTGAIGKEKKAQSFVKKNISKSLKRTAAQVMEELHINEKLVSKYRD